MSRAPTYNRAASFTNLQAVNPTGQPPGATLDVEFNAVKATTDALAANLALIQRDDGALANGSVGLAQLSTAVTIGFTVPVAWVTLTPYISSPASTAFVGGKFYSCLVSHTSGVFATDLAAGKWVLIADLTAIPLVTATQIAVTPSGLLTTNVQTSLQALDAGKAATSHTHVASAISDSTADGRVLLTGNLAAQKTALGLNSISVSQIAANLAFINPIAPVTLSANTNDWAPSGWATTTTVRLTTSSAINITGLLATTDGDIKVIDNVGAIGTAANVATLTSRDTSSLLANRILLPRPIQLRGGQSVALKYDGASAEVGWRLLAPFAYHPVGGSFKNLMCGNAAGNNFTYAGTANTDFKILADALMLEDVTGDSWRVTNVNVTAATGTTGANGFDGTGSLVNAPLFAWVIGNPATNTVAALLSRSATAPTMPAGYTFKTRVGGTFTNPSSQLLRTFQVGRRAQYVISASVTTAFPTITSGGNSTVFTSTPVAGFVPTTAGTIFMVLYSGSNVSVYVAPNALGTTAAGNSAGGQANVPSQSIFHHISMVLESMNVWYAASSAAAQLLCAGWEDNI